MSAATLERRARFRRIVAGVVAFAAVVSIFVVGRRILTHSAAPQSTPSADVKPAETKAADAKPAETKAADAKAAEEEAKKKADEEAKKKADEDSKKKNVDVEGLKKSGMLQINSFRFKDAAETGKQLIEADPEEATGYFVLGAALQNSGKWPEGSEVLNECVRKATKGPVGDCKAAGGHK